MSACPATPGVAQSFDPHQPQVGRLALGPVEYIDRTPHAALDAPRRHRSERMRAFGLQLHPQRRRRGGVADIDHGVGIAMQQQQRRRAPAGKAQAQRVDGPGIGPALAAQPRREALFTLHFDEGRDQVAETSRSTLDSAMAEIAARPVVDVLVVGHTDRVGTDAVNDALAKQRAETVRAELIRRGVPAESVQASGRGSREPVVPTPPGVAEPRNRRVEILVR